MMDLWYWRFLELCRWMVDSWGFGEAEEIETEVLLERRVLEIDIIFTKIMILLDNFNANGILTKNEVLLSIS